MAISEIIAATTLPGTEKSVRDARMFARDVLGEEHPSLPEVELCVDEAVTNGIEHTASGRGGRVTVLFSVAGDDVIAEVVDDGAGGARPVLREDPLAEHGRGLQIIDGLTLDWGVRTDGERTAVWMRFPGPPPQRT
ncbi:MAG TPA: ATP-binding protein [Spirillospora sp.]